MEKLRLFTKPTFLTYIMYKTFFVLAVIMLIAPALHAKDIPYAQEDRDRLIRLEVTLKEFKESVDKRFESIDKRFESIDKRFDQMINLFIGIVSAFTAIVAVTIGFAIWDRRTALSPVVRKSRDLEEREELLERALKEFARQEPRLLEILKSLRIM